MADFYGKSLCSDDGGLFFSMDGGLPTARYHSDIIDTILDTATDTRKVVLFSDQDSVGFTGGFTSPAHVDSTASEQSVSEMIFREVYVTATIC